MPAELATSDLGTNYGIALVEITPGETPVEQPVVEPPEKTEGEKAVMMAGILCEEPEFKEWLFTCQKYEHPFGATAVEVVRGYCNISSRAELATNPTARANWNDIYEDYRTHQRLGGLVVGG